MEIYAFDLHVAFDLHATLHLARPMRSQGKADLAERNLCECLFDDSPEVLQPALAKGIKIYPICARWERHGWFVRACPGRRPYDNLADALHEYLDEEF